MNEYIHVFKCESCEKLQCQFNDKAGHNSSDYSDMVHFGKTGDGDHSFTYGGFIFQATYRLVATSTH